MGVMVYSLLWVVQDLDHQPYVGSIMLGSLVLEAPRGKLCEVSSGLSARDSQDPKPESETMNSSNL